MASPGFKLCVQCKCGVETLYGVEVFPFFPISGIMAYWKVKVFSLLVFEFLYKMFGES